MLKEFDTNNDGEIDYNGEQACLLFWECHHSLNLSWSMQLTTMPKNLICIASCKCSIAVVTNNSPGYCITADSPVSKRRQAVKSMINFVVLCRIPGHDATTK